MTTRTRLTIRKARIPNTKATNARLLLCFALCALTGWIALFAQDSREGGLPFITNYAYTEYGANAGNWAACEDARGIMYFANFEGILEYDGTNWRLIRHPTISNSRALALHTDGIMYVSWTGDLGYLAPDETGTLQFVSLKEKLPEEERALQEVWATYSSEDGVWFRTSDRLFLWANDTFRVWKSEDGFHQTNYVRDKHYARIWNVGLTVMEDDTFRLVPGGEMFASERVYVLLPYGDDEVLVGTRTMGLFIYDGQTFAPFPTEADPYIKNTSLYDGTVLPDGKYVLSGFNNGAVIIDRKGKLIQVLNESTGLQDNGVAQTFLDSRNMLWLALYRGVAKVDLNSPFTYYGPESGLPAKTLYTMQRYRGTMYAGTTNGVYFLNKKTNRFEHVRGTFDQCFDMLVKNGELLVASNGMGVIKVDGSTFRNIRPNINYDYRASLLYPSKVDTTLVYVSVEGGFSALRRVNTGEWVEESFRDDLNTGFFGLEEEPDGRLWITGDQSGEVKLVQLVYHDGRISLPDSEVKVYTTDDGLPEGIIGVFDLDGTVYFTAFAEGQIYRFDHEEGKFFLDADFPLIEYTGDRLTYAMAKDDKGRTWADFGSGVFVAKPLGNGEYDVVSDMFRNFMTYETYGLYAENRNDNTVGWIVGPEGVVRFEGELEEPETRDYTAYVRGVRIHTDSVIYGGYGELMQDRTFNWASNTVAFSYAAPYYKSESDMQFSTFLEGLDQHWSAWSGQSEREYIHLPAGGYTFHVKARNVFGQESAEASYAFAIAPPWYAHWLAYLGYIVVAGILIYLLVRWRTAQLKKRSEELEEEVKLRTRQLQRRVDELAVVNKVQEGLVEKMDMKAIYALVGDKIREAFDAQVVVINTFDHEDGLNYYRYGYEKGELFDLDAPMPINPFHQEIINTGKPILINENLIEVAKSYGVEDPATFGEAPKSVLFAPLIVGEKVMGTVSLQNVDHEHAFTHSDLELLSTLTNSMAVALENARLFEESGKLLKEVQQRAEELAVINSVQEGLVEKMEMNAIYAMVGQKIRGVFDAQVVVINTFDHATNMCHYSYIYEKGQEFDEVKSRPIDALRQDVIDKAKTLIINSDFAGAIKSYGIEPSVVGEVPKSAVWVPLIVGEKVIGSVSLQNVDHENAFSESDVNLLTTLTNSMAVALENARLFEESGKLLKEVQQRAEELAVINSVQEGLVEKMEMNAIYAMVGRKIRHVFDAQVVVINTFDHKAGLTYYSYAYEKGKEYGKLEPVPIDRLRQKIIDDGKLLLINTGFAEAMESYGIPVAHAGQAPKSAVWVPLVVGDKVIGTVSLQNVDHENAFGESDVNLLTTLTNSMAVALENARLFEESHQLLGEVRQRAEELSMINALQQGLVEQVDTQGIYEFVGEKLNEIFDIQTVVVSSFDHSSETEYFNYATRKKKRFEIPPRAFDDFTRHIIDQHKALLINENFAEYIRKFSDEDFSIWKPPKSAIFVPITKGDQVIGNLSLQNVDHENAFKASHVNLLETMAYSVSVALENARLFEESARLLEEVQLQAKELEVINSIQQGLVEKIETEAIYTLMGDKIRDRFDSQAVVINTFDHDANLNYYRYMFEKGERFKIDDPVPINNILKRLIDTGKPVLVNENYAEFREAYGLGKNIRGEQPMSALWVPIMAAEKVMGSISLQNVDHENAFSDSDVEMLGTLANSMSIALENARLFEAAERRASEMGTVNAISQALTKHLEVDQLIEMVGESMRSLFVADIAYVGLLDKETSIIQFPYQYGDNLPPLKLGEGLTSDILLNNRSRLINQGVGNAYKELGIDVVGKLPESYLGVPIPVGSDVIGVISVQRTSKRNRFNESDMHLLETIATNVGIVIHNAQLFEEAERSREIAEEANEAKSAFLSTVSHELRTPLTSVMGFAKITKKRLEDKVFPMLDQGDSKIKRMVEQISNNLDVVVSEGERLTKLINDVLDLAKIEAGRVEWHMKSLQIDEVIDRAIAATTSLVEQKGRLKLTRRIARDLPDITGDEDKLIQVVVNLISNAVKFTEKGKIHISAKKKDGAVIVSVKDSGIGISEEDLPKVFEKFKQVGDTLTDKPTGTGLGLPICKEIVEYHGGEIWLESEPGKGSTFSFSLPAGTSKVSRFKTYKLQELVDQFEGGLAAEELHPNGDGQLIVVIDDEAPIRDLLSQELTNAGYHVLEAADGREGLEIVRSKEPDLVLLDVMMPEMNGYDLAAVLKNDPKTKDIPIIILSVVQDKERGLNIGIDRYLIKPIDTDLLFREITSLLGQGRSRRKVMVIDEDLSTVNTLMSVLKDKGYQVVEANGPDMVEKAIADKPDIVILNSTLATHQDTVKSLRMQKGMENVLFLVYE